MARDRSIRRLALEMEHLAVGKLLPHRHWRHFLLAVVPVKIDEAARPLLAHEPLGATLALIELGEFIGVAAQLVGARGGLLREIVKSMSENSIRTTASAPCTPS